MIVEGRVRVLGDDVNTDYIISSARKRQTIDPLALRAFIFESIAPDFAASVQPGDVIVAGRNFGCGSAMEIAVTVLQAAGIRAVLARSFSRSFYRNAINNGLLVVECDTSALREGDRVTVRMSEESAGVRIRDGEPEIAGVPLPPIMLRILECGGLVAFLSVNGGFRTSV
jgi:3-isopropylmalate/(R)-2-methylmalate dehydratase small subunit